LATQLLQALTATQLHQSQAMRLTMLALGQLQGAKTAHHLHEQPVDTRQSRATLGRTNKHKRLPATGNHSHATGLLTRQYTGDDIQTVLAEMLLINQAAPTRVLANESARISSTLKRLQAHHHESLLVGTMNNKRIGPID